MCSIIVTDTRSCFHAMLLLSKISYTNINFNLLWISNHIPSKVWAEITYTFPSSDGTIVEWMYNLIP